MLAFQTVPIQLLGGVSTKPDPKTVVAAKLLKLENGNFARPGAIKKRNGVRALSRSVIGSTTPIGIGQALASYRDELVMADRSALYAYDSSIDSWVSKGSFVSAYVTQRTVIRNTYNQSAQDSATHISGLQGVAWEDSSGGVRYAVVDTNTGLALVSDGLIDGSATRPKVLALGSFLVFLYVNGTTLYYRAVSTATPTVLSAPATVTVALTATPAYDAEVIGQRLFITWATASGWSISYYDANLNSVTPITVSTTTPTVLAVFADSLSENVVIAWYNGTAVQAQVRDYTLASVVMATATIETIANVATLTGTAIPGSASSLVFFYSISAASPSNYLTRKATVAVYGAASASAFLRSVGLVGKAFTYGSIAYVPLAFQSTLQSTYFLAGQDGTLVAKILPGLGGGLPIRNVLAESVALGGSRFRFSFLAKDLLTVTGGATATQTGVSAFTVDFFDAANSYARAELGLGLHFGGGFISLYDGGAIVEHGFHLYPEGLTTSLLDGDTGSAQSYQYKAVYSWIDNQGQFHRSAPSPAATQAKANTIDGTHRVSITIPTLRLTGKQSPRRKVMIELYRTIANGTVFYLQTSLTSPTYNDTAVDTVTITDSTTDATIQGNVQLYTTGEVENIAPGPVASMAVYGNRIIALDTTNPLQLWWSKQVIPGSPVEFSDLFVQNIDPVGGDITAIARMDAWLVIFKRRAIFVTSEEGPAASGASYTFASGQQVPSDVGCINPRSVNLGAQGIIFLSEKGWHLLTRQLTVQDLPDIDEWADETPTSALTMPNTHETRFTLSSGVALVHDDAQDQWCEHTATLAVDSCIWQSLFTYLRPDGQVRQETPGVFTDNGSAIKLKLKTAWLQFAGISGFQRAKSLTILGDYISAHRLTVSIAYDFNEQPSQVSEVDATSLLDGPIYGEDSVYGGAAAPTDSLVYGGAFPAYSFQVNLAQQKCTAIQITVEDSPEDPIGEGCSVSAITCVVGVKPGVRRLPAVRTA